MWIRETSILVVNRKKKFPLIPKFKIANQYIRVKVKGSDLFELKSIQGISQRSLTMLDTMSQVNQLWNLPVEIWKMSAYFYLAMQKQPLYGFSLEKNDKVLIPHRPEFIAVRGCLGDGILRVRFLTWRVPI